MKTWYNIQMKDGSVAEISISDEIGIWGVSAKTFISDLKKLGDVKNIILNVNSPGGSVFDGLAIYNALARVREAGTKITARIGGIAASAASFIVMAADTIEMPENAMMMIHMASGGAWGNADDMGKMQSILTQIDDSIVGIYTARTGRDEAEVREMLKNETWFSAADAKEAGFADTITPNVSATAKFDLENLPENIRNLFKPEPTQAQTELAVSITNAATEAGFGDHAAMFAVNYDSLDAAQAAIATGREIKALCAIAKKDDMLAGFLNSKTSLADARKALQNVLAASSAREVNNHQPAPSIEQHSAGLKAADVWAARRKQTNQGV